MAASSSERRPLVVSRGTWRSSKCRNCTSLPWRCQLRSLVIIRPGQTTPPCAVLILLLVRCRQRNDCIVNCMACVSGGWKPHLDLHKQEVSSPSFRLGRLKSFSHMSVSAVSAPCSPCTVTFSCSLKQYCCCTTTGFLRLHLRPCAW